MHSAQAKRRLAYSSLPILLLITFIENSFAADSAAMACDIGNELAGKIFKRAAAAKNAKNEVVAFENRTAFWDVYQYSSHCENVKKMASELSSKGMGKDAKPPSSEDVVNAFLASPDFAVPKSCWGKGSFGCKIIITEPPKGNTAGSQGDPSVYLLEGLGSGGGKPSTPNWKKFDQQKLVLPMTIDSKGK